MSTLHFIFFNNKRMQVSRDIFQLLAGFITDFETWRSFSRICKNSHNVAKTLWPQKKLELAHKVKTVFTNSVLLHRMHPPKPICCPHIDPTTQDIQQIDYYAIKKNESPEWLFCTIQIHNNDIIVKIEYTRDRTILEKTIYRHDGTVAERIEFIKKKYPHTVYNTTYYHPDGKTISYQGRHLGINDIQEGGDRSCKYGCWNRFTDDGKLVITEHWSGSTHGLDHVTFHNNTNTNNYNYDTIACTDPLDSSSSLDPLDSIDSSDDSLGTDGYPIQNEEPCQPIKEDTELYNDADGDGTDVNVGTRFEYESDPDSAELESLDSSVESLELTD